MMANTGLEGLFLFLAMGSGNDLLSLIDPTDYFKSRNIPVTLEKMVDLATTQPADGKAQIAHLLALRQLAEDAATVKKLPNVEELLKKLEEVAEGKKIQDSQGFSAEYARATAIALGSKLAPTKITAPENSNRQDALNWFPKEVSVVLSADFRLNNLGNKETAELRKKVGKSLPNFMKTEIYKALEEGGNARIDRFSLAYQDQFQNGKGKLFLRATGKVDHKRMVAFIRKTLPPNMQFKEMKSFRGQPISLFWDPNTPPAFALVGNEDFILAGEMQNGNQNSVKLIEEMLDVQRGKTGSVLDGPLAAKLKLISTNAGGLIVGQVPEEMRKGFMFLGPQMGFKTFPKEILIEMNQQGGNLKFQLQTELENAEDAKGFVTTTNALVQQGLAELKNAPPFPPNFPNPDKLLKGAGDLLKSIKVEAKGKTLTGELSISQEFINAYMGIALYFFGQLQGALAPPPLTFPPKVVACRHGDIRTMSEKLSA